MSITFYISGPITGLPNFNRHAFSVAAKKLREAGFQAINPFDIDASTGKEWEQYLRQDLAHMLTHADVLVALPGYQNSRGARLEIDVARRVNMPVITPLSGTDPIELAIAYGRGNKLVAS